MLRFEVDKDAGFPFSVFNENGVIVICYPVQRIYRGFKERDIYIFDKKITLAYEGELVIEFTRYIQTGDFIGYRAEFVTQSGRTGIGFLNIYKKGRVTLDGFDLRTDWCRKMCNL